MATEGKTQEEANAIVRSFLERLAAALRPSFPAHSSALAMEVAGTRLTTDRWNRITHVLASLNSLPGVTLREHEHTIRNIATHAVVVAQAMSVASFGMRDPPGRRWLALEITRDLDERIARIR